MWVSDWKSLSHVWLFATPWTVARQAPLSMEILQARILEWVPVPFSRGSSQPRDPTYVPHIAGGFFTLWATRGKCASVLMVYGLYIGRVSQVALAVKNPPASAGDTRAADSFPGSGRFPGGRHGSPLQYSCLENPMDRGAWWATVHGVAEDQTRLQWLYVYIHWLVTYMWKWVCLFICVFLPQDPTTFVMAVSYFKQMPYIGI